VTPRTLLVQGCSDRKEGDRAPAFDLYDGYYYRILGKAKREDAFDSAIDLVILSAEYGLLDPDEEIEDYDRKMGYARAQEFRDRGLPDDLAERVRDGGYERMVVNLGGPYEEAVAGFETEVEACVTYLSGQLGERGSKLKSLVRTDELTPPAIGGETACQHPSR
jgi:hypothetical protein